MTATFYRSSPSPDGETTTFPRQESIEKVRKKERGLALFHRSVAVPCPLPSSERGLPRIPLCAGYPRSGQSEERSSDDGARSTRVRSDGQSVQTVRTSFKPSLFHLHLTFRSITCVSYFVSFTVQLPEKELIGKRNWHVRKLHVSRRMTTEAKSNLTFIAPSI